MEDFDVKWRALTYEQGFASHIIHIVVMLHNHLLKYFAHTNNCLNRGIVCIVWCVAVGWLNAHPLHPNILAHIPNRRLNFTLCIHYNALLCTTSKFKFQLKRANRFNRVRLCRIFLDGLAFLFLVRFFSGLIPFSSALAIFTLGAFLV